MIQRIQTVFLLLAIVLLAITNLIPLASFQLSTGDIVDVSVLTGGYPNLTRVILITSILSIILCAASVFLYKSRKIQTRIAYIALLPILLLIGYFIGYTYGSSSSNIHLSLVRVEGIVSPVIAAVFILLAIRKIKADEKLVRSLDRIR